MTNSRNITNFSTNQGGTTSPVWAAAAEKFCEYCGRPLYRNVKRSGKKETWASFATRRFCSRQCSVKGLAFDRQMAKAKQKEEYRLERIRQNEEIRQECIRQNEEIRQERMRQNEEIRQERIRQNEEIRLERMRQKEEIRQERIRQKEETRQERIRCPSAPEGYREHPSYPGLFCNRQGKFWKRTHREVQWSADCYGYETGYVNFMHQGERIHAIAARLLAEAFLPDYESDDFVVFRDGDKHNLCVSNLVLVDYKSYFKQAAEKMQDARRSDYHGQVEIINRVKEEILIVEDYFNTGEFTLLHRYVNNKLYKMLTQYCVKNLCLGRCRTQTEVANVIAYLYDYLLTGHAVTDISTFCKRKLNWIKRTGIDGCSLRLPQQIEMIISKDVDFSVLWEKYKQAK